MGKYFYNEGSSLKQIHKIEEDYNKTFEEIYKLDTIVGCYVCIDDRWFDDNAIVFAKWWDDSTSDNDDNVFGNLKWDESQKMLITDSSKNTQDGSDRIITLLNLEGKCFYIAVCKSLEALESSHKEVKNKCKKYLKIAKNNQYSLSKKGKIWRKLMSTELGHRWATLTMLNAPSNANGRRTSIAKLKNFQKEVETQLNKIEEAVETYCNDINALANNTDTSKWWGFSEDVRSKVKKATKECKTKSTARIKNFKKNLNLAIAKTIEAKQGDLAKIENLEDLSNLD